MEQSKHAAAQAVSPRLTELSLNSVQFDGIQKAGRKIIFPELAQNMPPTSLGEFTTTLKNDHESRAEMSPLLCQRLSLNAGPKEALYHGIDELQRTMVSVHLISKAQGDRCVS